MSKTYETIGQLCAVMLEELLQHVQHWRGDIAYDLLRLDKAEKAGEPADFRWFLRPTGTRLVKVGEHAPYIEHEKEYIITYRPGEGYTFAPVN